MKLLVTLIVINLFLLFVGLPLMYVVGHRFGQYSEQERFREWERNRRRVLDD
jgi:hypothetical protein